MIISHNVVTSSWSPYLFLMGVYTNPFIQAAHHRASRSEWAGQGMEDLFLGLFMGHVRSEYVAYARLTSDNH